MGDPLDLGGLHLGDPLVKGSHGGLGLARPDPVGRPPATGGPPEGFVFHDLPHYFASKLIRHGFDVKRVQKLMRHAIATTTLNTYAGLWPTDDVARDALGELYREQPEVEGVVNLRRADVS